MKIPKPEFNKKAVKNAKGILSPNADKEYKTMHPAAYRLLEVIGIIALLLPSIIYVACMIIFDMPDTGWLMLGLLGTFIFGFGLFNIVGAWVGQYLGHKVTISAFIIGALLVSVSLFLLYSKSINDIFDKSIVDYYFMSLLFLLLPLFIYPFFRMNFDGWIISKNKIRRRDLRRMKKGAKNFWFYETANRELKLGILYYINKLFIIVYPAAFALALLTGLIRAMSIPICILTLTSYVLCAVMAIFSQIQDNKDFHGKPFVLLARSRNDGIDSVFIDILFVIFILSAAYTQLSMTLELWGIVLPRL